MRKAPAGGVCRLQQDAVTRTLARREENTRSEREKRTRVEWNFMLNHLRWHRYRWGYIDLRPGSATTAGGSG